MTTAFEAIEDADKGLHVKLCRGYLDAASREAWWATLTENVHWHRVAYRSGRFKKHCETPCFTAFYGGFERFEPYAAIPSWLLPLVERVRSSLGVPFNAILLRLYLDGADEIAWHTDGRTFLGETPTIGSLSLGASAHFQLRRMRNVWPELGGGDDGIDYDTPQRDLLLGDGDLLVMHGPTQRHWHHRVPKAASRRPRININFRYILPGTPDAERGQKTYYKYMVHGDAPPDVAGRGFGEILRRAGSLLSFAAADRATTAPSPAGASAPPPASEAREGLPDARESAGSQLGAPPEPLSTPSSSSSSSSERSDRADRIRVDEGSQAEWACPACTLLNPPLAPLCRLCQTKNPAEAAAQRRCLAAAASALERDQPRTKRAKLATSEQPTLTSMGFGRVQH